MDRTAPCGKQLALYSCQCTAHSVPCGAGMDTQQNAGHLSLGDEGATGTRRIYPSDTDTVSGSRCGACGSGTAVAGNIAFLGLLGPQIALRITGMRHRLLLPLAALISSILLVVADMLARICFTAGDSGRNSGLHDRHSLFYLSDDELDRR